MSEFAIYDLPVLSGLLGISPLPTDLDLLLAWQPSLVVSMTTAAEMADLGAGAMGADLIARGVAWLHLPIADFGTPGADVRAVWPDVSRRAQDILWRGGRVLIHCRGGCGRSGMAALRLMVEADEPPGPALARLRAARPCAVETEAQLAWASDPHA